MPHIEEDLLDQYAMGTLPSESIRELEEHLLTCAHCQTRLRETDEFLTVFSAAASQVDARPVPLWQRLGKLPIWTGAVAVVGLATVLVLEPPKRSPEPAATLFMQSLRGPSEMRTASGRSVSLVFDVPVREPSAKYEIQVVDPVGHEILKTGAQLRDGRLNGVLPKLARGSYWIRIYRAQAAPELLAEYGLQAE